MPDRAVQQQLGRYFVTAVGEGNKADRARSARAARREPLGDRGRPQVGDLVVEGRTRPGRGRPSRVPVEPELRRRTAASARHGAARRRPHLTGRPMARFFIDRPVFAIVISLFLLLAGTLSLVQPAGREFRGIALPTVQVNANYLGASSDVVEESVTVPLDQQINGVTDMFYINAGERRRRHRDHRHVRPRTRRGPRGGRGPEPRFAGPIAAAAGGDHAGVTVRKQSPDTLMYFVVHSPDAPTTGCSSSTTPMSTCRPAEARQGRGRRARVRFRVRHAHLAAAGPHGSLGLTAADVVTAISEQNVQAPAGQIGQPPSGAGRGSSTRCA